MGWGHSDFEGRGLQEQCCLVNLVMVKVPQVPFEEESCLYYQVAVVVAAVVDLGLVVEGCQQEDHRCNRHIHTQNHQTCLLHLQSFFSCQII